MVSECSQRRQVVEGEWARGESGREERVGGRRGRAGLSNKDGDRVEAGRGCLWKGWVVTGMAFQSSRVQSAALPHFYCLIYTPGDNIRSRLVEIQRGNKVFVGTQGLHAALVLVVPNP